MMDCKKVQDVLLTDYIDGCIHDVDRIQLESHLQECPACREFWKQAKADLEPVAHMERRESLPQEVVSRVMHKVQQPSWIDICTRGLDNIWNISTSIARPVPRWVLASGLFLFAVTGIIGTHQQYAVRQQQGVLLLAQVMEFQSGEAEAVVRDYGTSIEDYFLEQKEAT